MNTHRSGAQSQAEILASLPLHLCPFVQTQDYRRYTPRDQAVNESVQQTLQSGLESYPDEWLLHAELLTLGADGLRQRAQAGLETLAQRRPDLAQLIAMALVQQGDGQR